MDHLNAKIIYINMQKLMFPYSPNYMGVTKINLLLGQ